MMTQDVMDQSPGLGKPWLLTLVIMPFFLWGTSMVAMKGAIQDTTPLFLAAVRILPAGMLVLLFGVLTGRPQPQGWKAWAWIGAFALVDGTVFQGCLAQGLVRTNAGLGSVMIDSQPLAVALLACWCFGERIRVWGWLGLGLGLVGISILGLPPPLWSRVIQGQLSGAIALLAQDSQGQGWMLLAALAMALGTVMMRPLAHHADPVVATGWHMVLGGLPLLLGAWWWETEPWQHLGGTDWWALAYATVCGSAIAYGLFFYFASQGNLTSLSALTFLTPIFALIFGHWILGESLNWVQGGGVGLTLVSVYLVNQRDGLAHRLPLGWLQRAIAQGREYLRTLWKIWGMDHPP